MNSQSTTDTTVCMPILTRRKLPRSLKVSWNGVDLENTTHPKYLALCYSIAEYVAPVWTRSTSTDILDPELNKACRAITGCLKPTYLEGLYLLVGIVPSDIRNELEWNEPNRWNKTLIPCLVTSQQEAASSKERTP